MDKELPGKLPMEPTDKRSTRTVGAAGKTSQADVAQDQQPEPQGKDSGMLLPRASQPASMRFSTPESKLTMSASLVSKPSQSWISAKTGMRFGPGAPVRVRVIR